MVTVGALVCFGLLVCQCVLEQLVRFGKRLETAVALVGHLFAMLGLNVSL